MTAQILDGKATAAAIKSELAIGVAALKPMQVKLPTSLRRSGSIRPGGRSFNTWSDMAGKFLLE